MLIIKLDWINSKLWRWQVLKKLNNFICIGLIFNGVYLVSNHFRVIPDFIKGLCAGIGISFILLGAYAEKHDISKLRNYKKALLNKALKR